MESITNNEKIDQLHMLRNTAVEAASAKNFDTARSNFADAVKLAVELNLQTLAAGLLADQSIVEFLCSNKKSALICASESLERYENESKKNGESSTAHIILLGNAIFWMRQEQGRSEYEGFEVIPGSCSELCPHPDLEERPAPPFLLLWYQLATLESEFNLDVGMLAKLEQRTGNEVCVPYDIELAEAQLITSCIRSNSELFLEHLCRYLALLNCAEEGQRTDRMVLPKPGISDHVLPAHWGSPKYYPTALHAITAFCLGALANELKGPIIELTVKLSESMDPKNKVMVFMKRIGNQNEADPETQAETLIAANILLCRTFEERITPLEAFNITFYFWGWFASSPFKAGIGDSLAKLITSVWYKVLSSHANMLVNPSENAMRLQERLNDSSRAFNKVALVLLAANEGIQRGLPEEVLTEIRNSLTLA